MDTAAATEIVIDWLSGHQTTLNRSKRIIGYSPRSRGRVPLPVELEQVPEVLSDPEGWIQWEGEASTDPAESDGWSEPEFDTPCVSRIYARGVVHVMLLWDDA